jgi:hypothetical protein
MPNRFADDTIRLTIMRKFKALYEAVDDTTHGIKFSNVQIGPLGNQDAKKLAVIGIVAGPETKSDLFPLKTSLLEVNVEFRFTVNQGDERAGIMAERILGVVQQVIYDDDTLGGLVIKTDELGNQINMIDYGDKSVEGVVQFQTQFRHATRDVYLDTPA